MNYVCSTCKNSEHENGARYCKICGDENQLESYLKEQEEKELDCFMHCMAESLVHMKKDENNHAAAYLENAARSLRAIDQIRKEQKHEKSTKVFLIGHVLGGGDSNF